MCLCPIYYDFKHHPSPKQSQQRSPASIGKVQRPKMEGINSPCSMLNRSSSTLIIIYPIIHIDMFWTHPQVLACSYSLIFQSHTSNPLEKGTSEPSNHGVPQMIQRQRIFSPPCSDSPGPRPRGPRRSTWISEAPWQTAAQCHSRLKGEIGIQLKDLKDVWVTLKICFIAMLLAQIPGCFAKQMGVTGWNIS